MPLNDENINITKIKSTYKNFQYGKEHPVLSPGKNLAATFRKKHDGLFYSILSRFTHLHALDQDTFELNISEESSPADLVQELNRIYKSSLQCAYNRIQNENQKVQSEKATEYLRAIAKLRQRLGQFAFHNNLKFQPIVAGDTTKIDDLEAIRYRALTGKAIAAISQAIGQEHLKIQNNWLALLKKLGYPLKATEIKNRAELRAYLNNLQQQMIDTALTVEETQQIENKNAQYRRRIDWSWVDEETQNSFQIAKLKKAKKYLENFCKEYHLPSACSLIDAEIKRLEADKLISKVTDTYKQYQWAHKRYWFQHYPKDFITWLRRRSGDTTAYKLFYHLGKLVDLEHLKTPFNPNQASKDELVQELNRVYKKALKKAKRGPDQITEQNQTRLDKLKKGLIKTASKVRRGNSYSEEEAISIIVENKKTKNAATSLKEIKKLRRYYCDFALANGLKLNDMIQGSSAAIDELKQIKHRQKVAKAVPAITQALGKGRQEYKNILIRKLYGKYKISDGWLRSLADQGFILPDLEQEQSLNTKEDLEAYFQRLQANIANQELSREEIDNIERPNFWSRLSIKIGLSPKQSTTQYHIKKLREAKGHLQKFYYSHKLTENFAKTIDEKIKALRTDATSDYIDEYKAIRQFIEDFKSSPWKTTWWHKFTPDRWTKSHNKQIFLIIKQLSNMRLSEHCMHLMNAFMKTDEALGRDLKSGRDAKERLQAFLDVLYATFNALSIQEGIALEDLKKLKKLINTFAEQNDFEKKLFNLQKAYRKKIEDDEIAAKMSLAPHRVYGYLQNTSNVVDAKKVKSRARKKKLSGTSIAVTVVVAIGEGIMAAVFFAPLVAALGPWSIPIILLVGVCGFDVNYFLFKKDSLEALKQLFVTGIFKDAKGYEISTTKKVLIHASIFSSIAIALVFGSFTFNTAIIAITALLAAASVACPPLVIALAAFLAVVAVVANSTMFYCMMADFVKNDRILQMASYFKRTFWDIWKQPQEWASANPHAITTGMKVKHYLGAVATVGLNVLFLATGIVVCGFMTMITLGLGHTQAVEVLGRIANFAPQAKDLIANIVVSAFAAPLNSYFYWRGMMRTLGTVKDGIISFASKCFSPIKSLFQFRREVDELKNNPLRTVDVISNTTLSTLHCSAAVFNAAGQGGGPYHDPNSIANVQKIFDSVENLLKQMGVNILPHFNRLGEAYADVLAGAIAGLGSFGVNTLAIIRALQLPENDFFIKLAPEVQLLLLQGKITFDQAKVLSKIPDEGMQVALGQKAVDGALSIQQMATFIKPMQAPTVNNLSSGPVLQQNTSDEQQPLLANDEDQHTSDVYVQLPKTNDDAILEMPGKFNKKEDSLETENTMESIESHQKDSMEQVEPDLLLRANVTDHFVEPTDRKQRAFTFFARVANDNTRIEDLKYSVDKIFEL